MESGYQDFGFANIYDYALERFAFSPRKTRYLLYLGRKLSQLPQLTEALAKGVIGWTKATKVASVATAKDEEKWIESAVALSARQLESKIRDGLQPAGGKVAIWLSAEQASVWQRAMEVCRRMCGEEIDPGRCLDLIAGEFLATYEYQMAQERAEEAMADTPVDPAAPAEIPGEIVEIPVEINGTEELPNTACPEDDSLPSPTPVPYGKSHRAALERDRYRCQYPGCSGMSGLHVHHIRFRSRSGRKSRDKSNSLPNLITLCFVHHRMIHAGIIGLKGKAPDELVWRRPELMDAALERISSVMIGEVCPPVPEASPPEPPRVTT